MELADDLNTCQVKRLSSINAYEVTPSKDEDDSESEPEPKPEVEPEPSKWKVEKVPCVWSELIEFKNGFYRT